jgi:hypothetical protein
VRLLRDVALHGDRMAAARRDLLDHTIGVLLADE